MILGRYFQNASVSAAQGGPARTEHQSWGPEGGSRSGPPRTGATLHLQRSPPWGGARPGGWAPDPTLVGGEQQASPDAEPIPPQSSIARH